VVVLAAGSAPEVVLTLIIQTINRTAKVRKAASDHLEVERMEEEQLSDLVAQISNYHQSQTKWLWVECVACQGCLEAKVGNQAVRDLSLVDPEEEPSHQWAAQAKETSNQILALVTMHSMFLNTAQVAALAAVSAEAMGLAV
jgi:hypothetical protein